MRMPLARLPAQVAKLIPRLASEHDGEVVGIVRAIQRTLKTAGHDLHDLAAVIERGPEQPRVVYRDDPQAPWDHIAQWTQIAEYCLEHDRGRLNAHERSFVREMALTCCRKGEPSRKQAAWLQGIHSKLHRAERGQ